MTQEVLKLALEFLEDNQDLIEVYERPEYLAMYKAVIDKCKKALAQPEPCDMGAICIGCSPRNADGSCPSSQPEQEPVAWRAPNWSNLHGEYGYRDFDDPVCGIDGKPSPNNEPLYTHSQRTWVGLFDEEIEILFQTAAGADEEVHIRFARALESKLKEVNT
jgi:hypothetical protein